VETSTERIVTNEAGVARMQTATGKFQQVFFRLQNKQTASASVPSSTLTLTDAKGRTYTSDFEVRQVQAGGVSSAFGKASIAPGASVLLNLTFDVAPDATGLVLHMKDGNDVEVH